jgi:hypothetical protein
MALRTSGKKLPDNLFPIWRAFRAAPKVVALAGPEAPAPSRCQRRIAKLVRRDQHLAIGADKGLGPRRRAGQEDRNDEAPPQLAQPACLPSTLRAP